MLNKISQIESPDYFTDLCNSIFAEEFFDFQVIDDSGGDAGNDGYSESKKILFQYYCPKKQKKLTDSKLKHKIKKDLAKAQELVKSGKYDIKTWVFVTPMDLREDVQTFIREEAKKINLIGVSWSGVKLSNLLEKHPFLKKKFPDLSNLDLNEKLSEIANDIKLIKEEVTVGRRPFEEYPEKSRSINLFNDFEFDASEKFLISKVNKVHLICNHDNFDFSIYYKNALNHLRKRALADWKMSVSLNIVKFKEDIKFFNAFDKLNDLEKIEKFEWYKNEINKLYKYFQGVKRDKIKEESDLEFTKRFNYLKQLLIKFFEEFKLKN